MYCKIKCSFSTTNLWITKINTLEVLLVWTTVEEHYNITVDKKFPPIIVQKFTINIHYKENSQDLMYINLWRLVSIKKIWNDKILITWMDSY